MARSARHKHIPMSLCQRAPDPRESEMASRGSEMYHPSRNLNGPILANRFADSRESPESVRGFQKGVFVRGGRSQ